MSVFFVPREIHEQPAPQRNASASQRISTTSNQQQETDNHHSNKQQHCYHHHNNHQQPTTNAQSQEQQQLQPQQQRQHAAPNNNSNNCSIKLRPRTHFFPHRCPRLRTKKSKAAATTAATIKLRHMASNSMETPSQRQMTQGPQSPSSGPEQQHTCASHKNGGGPSMTTILCAN